MNTIAKRLLATLIVMILFLAITDPNQRTVITGRAQFDRMGTVNIQTGDWVPLDGPTAPGGIIDDLVIAPAATDTLFALLPGRNSERLFRSDNGSLSWRQVYTFTTTTTSTIDNLSLDPSNPENFYVGGKAGLYHSPNGGVSWTQVYTLGEVSAVVSPTLLYAGGEIAPGDENCIDGSYFGVARSQDGGTNWDMSPVGCASLLSVMKVEPGNHDVIYVGGSTANRPASLLLRSEDGGQSWVDLINSAPGRTGNILSLIIDPQNPLNLYGTDWGGFFYSKNGGVTWGSAYKLPPSSMVLAESSGSLYAAERYSSSGRASVYRSDDGGLSWWVSLIRLPSYALRLTADPQHSDRVYAGLYGYGIYLSQNGGSYWQERNIGIRSLPFISSLAVAKNSPNHIYAASETPRGGLFLSLNGGIDWTEVISDTPLSIVAVNPISPPLAYAGGLNGIYQTEDGLQWYQSAYEKAIYDIAVAPSDPRMVYAGGATEKQISPTSQGFVATYIPPGTGTRGYWKPVYISDTTQITAVAVHPENPMRVYAGGSDLHKLASIFGSEDGGETWRQLFNGIGFYVSRIVVDPKHPDTIYAGESDSILRSRDGGETWEPMPRYPIFLGYGFSTKAFTIDSLSTPYVGFTEGIWRFDAGQNQWILDGLPGFYTQALAIQPGMPERLMAGGLQGLWQKELLPAQRHWLPLLLGQ